MRLKLRNGYLDYDLELFWDVVEPLNTRVQQISRNVDPEYADMMDYGDTADQLVGVALAVAQVYFASVCRYHNVSKDAALDLGPKHSTGHALARIVNHGANFWKHADEWNWVSLSKREMRILAVFGDLGMPGPEYSLATLVAKITNSNSADLDALRLVLEQWRTAVEETASL